MYCTGRRSQDAVHRVMQGHPGRQGRRVYGIADSSAMFRQVRGLHLLLADAAASLPQAGAHAAKLRLERMHFATLPVPAMQNWLPAVLRQWRSPRRMLIATSGRSGVCKLIHRSSVIRQD